jgi:hypothetical protein
VSAAVIALLTVYNLFFTFENGMYVESFDRVVYLIVTALAVLPFALVGAMIVWYQNRNTIGWLLLIISGSQTLQGLATSIGTYALVLHPGSLPGAIWLAWLTGWLIMPFLVALPLIPLLFPTGRPRTRRGRWIAAALVAYGVAGFLLNALQAQLSLFDPKGEIIVGPNPLGVIPPQVRDFILPPTAVFYILLFVAGIVSLGFRYWHAARVERQQIKWLLASVALALAVLFLTILFAVPDPLNGILQTLTLYSIPIAIGIAILRYRLWDIDIIIRKTLTYALVVSLLVLVYFGIVILLQQMFATITGQHNEVVTVISTLAIAALFVPLRNKIQEVIDRRFYRKKYDAQQVLQDFAQTVRDETDLEKLTARLVQVVDETMQPESMSLWLKNELTERARK